MVDEGGKGQLSDIVDKLTILQGQVEPNALLITLWNKDRTDFEVVLGGGKLGILGFGLGEK